MKLGKSELCVLKVLKDQDEWVLPFIQISSLSNLNVVQVKRAVRSLARKGFTMHTTAFGEDDGMLRGSGYMITQKGLKFIP